ncbi:MAG: hypothetical protein AAB855_02360, partial [Patescibacteria group bacterium]
MHHITPVYILKKYFLFYVIIAAVAGGFYGGYVYGRREVTLPFSQEPSQKNTDTGRVLNAQQSLPGYLSKDVNFDLFWDVWQRVKGDYITKDTPDTKLFYGAISG